MSVAQCPLEDFNNLLRATPLSLMTSELDEKLRVFSCECSKQSCLLLLQDLTDKGQWKLAIRSLLIYKIKGLCFRHFMSAMPLSRIPSNLADMVLEDRTISYFDAVQMAFDEERLFCFVLSQKDFMCANLMKYNVSLNSMQMEMMTRERQMVLDLNQAKCDLEEQKLCTMKFSQVALNLQEALNEHYMSSSEMEFTPTHSERPAVTKEAEEKPRSAQEEQDVVYDDNVEQHQVASDDNVEEHGEQHVASGDTMQVEAKEEDACDDSVEIEEEKDVASDVEEQEGFCDDRVEMHEEKDVASDVEEPRGVCHRNMEEPVEQASFCEEEGDEQRQTEEGGNVISPLTLQKMQAEIDEYKNCLFDAEVQAVQAEKDLRDELARVHEESMKRVREETEHVRRQLATETVATLATVQRELFQEKARNVVALSLVEKESAKKMEVLVKKNLNLEKDLGRLRAVKNGRERVEEKVRKDMEKMRVKLVETEERVVFTEARVLSAQQEIVETTEMWKARLVESEDRGQEAVAMFVIMQADYKAVREEGEMREKMLTIDMRKMEIYDSIQKKLKLDLKRAPCSGLVGTKILAKVQADAACRVGRCWKAYTVRKAERELRERVLREAQERIDARREAERLEAAAVDAQRLQLFAELSTEAVTVRRIVDLDHGDDLSTNIFDQLMRMRDPKRMLFATIAWTVRQDLVIHDLPESVMVDFQELACLMEMLPGSESEDTWTRLIEVYGPGEEESIVARSPPRLANWPEERGDYRALFNMLEEPLTQLACAEALVPWFEASVPTVHTACCRVKCGKVLLESAVRCAQCRRARYCCAECGLADVVHHDAECHLHTLRALFRLYRSRAMAPRSVVRMFFGGPPSAQPHVHYNAGCYATCCVGQRVQEIRFASGA